MKKTTLSLILVSAAVSAAFAGPKEDREAIMKERAGLLRRIVPMAKGEVPFDAAKAQEVLEAVDANAKKGTAADLFPEGSQQGSEASPKIWENFAAFQAEWDKYAALTTEAAASKPQDAAALGAELGKIGAECGSCHQAFRISN